MSNDLASGIAGRAALSRMGGKDIFAKTTQWTLTDDARALGMYPYFRALDMNQGPEAILEGKKVIMFGSNNYLGLTMHPKVREAAAKALAEYGPSMTGSRLVNGTLRLHKEFEEKLAAFMNKEAAIVFTTGYQVNLAAISGLLSNKKSVAVMDKMVHASIYDGVRLAQASGAQMIRFHHNDAADLDRRLEALQPDEGALVITDGVFSTEGEIADLPGMVAAAKKHGVRMLVDDAHGLGVLGNKGRGVCDHLGVQDDVDMIGGTFSKSLASIGGWLVGPRKALDYIQHFAPSFMFAASCPPPSVAAAMAAFEIMQEETWRIEKVRENAIYMRDELRKMGFETGPTDTAIVPIYLRQELITVGFWKALLEDHGVYVNPFIPPGVPPKNSLLRTSYMATHERHHLDRGLEAFRAVGKQFGVISG
ncbi:MAG: aminotransferase class I/II-fold pyridoxal phosphate-dependent enzyme [Polyangiales bacterium]